MRTARSSPPGLAYLVAIIFLAIFACAAVGIAMSASSNLVASRNRLQRCQAAALSEAGFQLLQRLLGGLTVPATHSADDLHQAIANHLRSSLAGSTMLVADSIEWDSTGVTIPPLTIMRPDGQQGQIILRVVVSGGALDATTITIHSTGRFGDAEKTTFYNMTVQRGRSVLADYGVASKSAIQLTGSSQIVGANDPKEASILSASYSTPRPVRMVGECSTTGDVAICNPSGEIQMRGGATIAGERIVGVVEPEWPRVDPSVFRPYATNIYSGSGGGDLVLSNIRIPPNTNPNFSGNTTIYGVVYIEPPNRVTFSGNTTIIGAVVCEEPTLCSLKTNQILFTGNVTTASVESLPEGPAYDGLRQMTGSFLLAPGYSVQFSGNCGTIEGCLVASEFKFTGNAGGRIKGGIINLRDSDFVIATTKPLIIDKAGMPEQPAGLTTSYRLVCVSGSYRE